MAPIAKENEVLTATETAARPNAAATAPTEASSKPQPVALEVPVTVNGARTVDGSEKREPFSESTKTVLVFGNGAVIRLQSPVAPGQLLFLTNDKTKKEVVCQVVKSKNYRNVSGYVELEFTEAVIGFWGMRFPSDRIGTQSPVASAAGSPLAPKSIEVRPAPPQVVKPAAPVAPKPDATANFNALKALASSPSPSQLPFTVDTTHSSPLQDSIQASNKAPVSTPAEVAETKPVTVIPPPAVREPGPAAGDSSTEALKLQAARLQEELSSLLFAENAKTAATPPATNTVFGSAEIHETATKILEFTKPAKQPAAPDPESESLKNAPPAKATASAPVKSILDEDEVKIPSWLEPLARNAANASAAEETAPKPDLWHHEEPALESYIAPEPEASATTGEFEVAPVPLSLSLSADLPSDGSRGSNKGMLMGLIAAGLVLAAAGGVWFSRNQSGAAGGASSSPAVSAAVVPPGSQPAAQNATSAPGVSSSTSSPTPAPLSTAAYSAPASGNAGNGANKGANDGAALSLSNAVVKTSQPAAAQPAPAPQKKPMLGEVRLAAPTVTRNGQAQSANDADPALSIGNGEPVATDSLGSGLASHSKQPVAPAEPLPVGGDVKPAKLLASVSPMYPSLAKTQHVSGDVKVDALIDANGRVTTMKVVSGPTLLHQAAMEALRQWKYQPAMLDGKPVPMHLTVTLQFRLQ